MIEYRHDKKISDAQLRPLYQAVGWTAYLDQVSDLGQMLAASQDVISAWDQDQLVGLVRTVGDGHYVALIQDILVLPAYQKQGIGRQLLNRIQEASQAYRQVFLVTDTTPWNQSVREWYDRRGLVGFAQAELTGFIANQGD